MKHIKKKLSLDSFVDQPTAKPVKFDKLVSRDQAMKSYVFLPEGAPFWKYTVKDSAVKAPVKGYKISENPSYSRTEVISPEKEPTHFNCGRL